MVSIHSGNRSSPGDAVTQTFEGLLHNDADMTHFPSTARSSFTLLDNERRQLSHDLISDREVLDAEIANEQHDIDEYAGDDPHKPTVDKIPATPEGNQDQNLVTWEGPKDPANPKNWKSSYRWFLTGLCCITTLNVWVDALHFSYHSHSFSAALLPRLPRLQLWNIWQRISTCPLSFQI